MEHTGESLGKLSLGAEKETYGDQAAAASNQSHYRSKLTETLLPTKKYTSHVMVYG